jgi:hypothetical protein
MCVQSRAQTSCTRSLCTTIVAINQSPLALPRNCSHQSVTAITAVTGVTLTSPAGFTATLADSSSDAAAAAAAGPSAAMEREAATWQRRLVTGTAFALPVAILSMGGMLPGLEGIMRGPVLVGALPLGWVVQALLAAVVQVSRDVCPRRLKCLLSVGVAPDVCLSVSLYVSCKLALRPHCMCPSAFSFCVQTCSIGV